MTNQDRIRFASLDAKTPAQRRREAEAESHKAGWERQFWSLLSPATAELLKAELAKKD